MITGDHPHEPSCEQLHGEGYGAEGGGGGRGCAGFNSQQHETGNVFVAYKYMNFTLNFNVKP